MAQPVHPKPSKPTFLLPIPFRATLPCSIAFLALLCLAGYYALHQHHNRRLPKLTTIDPPYLFLNSSDPSFISSALRSLTRGPHLAGTRGAHRTAQHVLAQLRSSGLPAHVADYEAVLSYPLKASLSAHFANGTSTAFALAEPSQGASGVVPPYHAYAPSGAASRVPAVYANYGREEDYRALGVSVRGFIAVVRRGGGPRGEVVRRAAREGAVAVLMYAEGEKFRDGVERGTVMTGLGDPLTPGWAHVDGGEALDEDDPTVRERFPSIPSMPISAETAGEILKTLGGAAFPEEWRDNTLNHVWGWVGPGPTTLSFSYQEERRIAKIQNVLAVVRGQEEPDRYVLLGNHRDAWTYGAVDPNSGTAALLDIARRLGILLRSGWTPRRSIILCSWDAEEFGMIGSTEWVEQNLETLKSKAVAYLNVDCAVQGPGFFAGATPQLDALLVEITKKINDPDSGGMTVYQSWVATNAGISIGRLSGVESDFAAFVQHAGVPSVDLYYGKDFPVYHTSFDSYDWMEKYGDRLFHRHVAVAGIWGLLALHLADDLVLPFDYLSYAAQLQEHTKELTALLDGAIHLRAIHTAIEELLAAAHEAGEESKKLREQDSLADSSNIRLRAFNDRMMLAERGFLEAEGLKGREWFKHLIYGPSSDYNPKLSFFPGIGDAISRSRKMSKREGQAAIQHEVWRVARAIQRAAIVLRGDLT